MVEPSNVEIYEWLEKQDMQTERDDTGEYQLLFLLDMPKLLREYAKWTSS